MRPFVRKLVLLLALAVLYGGPVVACVCPDRDMHEMPCCPDAPRDACHDLLPSQSFDTVCDPAATQLLSTSVYDVSMPVGNAHSATPEWRAQAPPPIVSAFSVSSSQRPLYLTTLRLRI